MSERLQNTMKWLWCLFVLYSASLWRPVNSVTTVRTPPGEPSTIEAQAKFFQDFFSVQLSPYKIEFGHVCEDPNTWEQRYEKKDFKNHRDMGKVRWGDKKGGYGEHYWDLNHAGHTDNHGDGGYDDDGSYHEDDDHDAFDEPSEQSNNYDTDHNHDDDSHEENNRAKRAHTRHSVQTQRKEKVYEDEPAQTRYKPRKAKKHQKEKEEQEETEDRTERQKPLNKEIKKDEEETPKPKEKNNVILVIDHHDREELEEPTTKAPENNHFVPYEGGAGVRQHYQPEVTAAASAPRLFLEPSTGHIVDRTTGQAYVLQPIRQNFNYN